MGSALLYRVHGIAHSKAANRERDANGHRKKRSGQLRHTFREKIWGLRAGWILVGSLLLAMLTRQNIQTTRTAPSATRHW
jgi:hypothetical protein